MERGSLVGLIAVVLVGGLLIGAGLLGQLPPTIPPDAMTVVTDRTLLEGPVTPDAAEGVDPAELPRSPYGGECLERIEMPAGPLDLCWEAWREPWDADPEKDYYRLRMYGSFGGETGDGVRWVQVGARLLTEPAANVVSGWPEGEFEGACQDVSVDLMFAVGDPAQETLCGRTNGRLDTVDWSQAATWTCTSCLLPDHDTRAISLHQIVAVPQGTVPAWELSAGLGG